MATLERAALEFRVAGRLFRGLDLLGDGLSAALPQTGANFEFGREPDKPATASLPEAGRVLRAITRV